MNVFVKPTPTRFSILGYGTQNRKHRQPVVLSRLTDGAKVRIKNEGSQQFSYQEPLRGSTTSITRKCKLSRKSKCVSRKSLWEGQRFFQRVVESFFIRRPVFKLLRYQVEYAGLPCMCIHVFSSYPFCFIEPTFKLLPILLDGSA